MPLHPSLHAYRPGSRPRLLGILLVALMAASERTSAAGAQDSSTADFTRSGNTVQTAYQPVTVALADGRVLKLGGSALQPQGGPLTALSSCEVFTPASGTWAATGAMITARLGCGACLLANGQVLVAGGFDVRAGVRIVLAQAETWDPRSGTWTAFPALPLGLWDACLLALANGDMLALGTAADGTTGGARYHGATASWSAIAPTLMPRSAGAYALLPGGQALVAGGYALSAAGGAGTPTTSCELYDPARDSWSPTGALLGNHLYCRCLVLPSGAVLIGAGSGGSGAAGNTGAADCELYAQGSWALTGQLPYQVTDAAVCLLASGDVLSAGGTTGAWLSEATRYSSATGTWSAPIAMAASHYAGALAALPGDQAVIVDGWDEIPVGDGAESFASDPGSEVYQVRLINTAPSFLAGPDQAVRENSGLHTVPGWATAISPGLPAESGQTVTFLVSASNPALFSVPPAVDSSGTLSYTLAANTYGTATVTIQAHDNGGTAQGGQDTSPAQTFTIAVAFVNVPPTFTIGGDQIAQCSAGMQSVSGFLSAVSPGPPDESALSVQITVANNANPLFAVQPAIDGTGTLTYAPAGAPGGVATVAVTVTNSGGTANGGIAATTQTFTITIIPAIQPPTVQTLTLYSVVGVTVSGQLTFSDPDHQLPPGAPTATATGISQLGPLTVAADGLVTFTATQAGSQRLPVTLTVAGTAYAGMIQLYANALSTGRPLVASLPQREQGASGAPWSYALTVDPLSLAAGDALAVRALSDDAALAAASITPTSGNQFAIAVPALDAGGGPLQRLTLIVTDLTTHLSDLQTIFLVVLPPGGPA